MGLVRCTVLLLSCALSLTAAAAARAAQSALNEPRELSSRVSTPSIATPVSPAAVPCEFNAGASQLSISCANAFAVTLAANNGALTGIYAANGRMVSPGSRHGCLFGASGPNNTYCGSCGCPGMLNVMSYAWINASDPRLPAASGGALAMTFAVAPGGAGFNATVLLTTMPALNAFDLTFTLVSPPATGQGYFWLLFPSEILFDTSELTALHMPLMPGVSLLPGFFARGQSFMWYYPGGPGAGFAGFVQVDSSNGSLVIHDVSGPDVLAPYTTSLELAGAGYPATMWMLAVYHMINVTAQCSPTNAPGSAPPCALGVNGTLTRRFMMTSAPADPLASMSAYAAANGMLPGTSPNAYSPLRTKLAAVAGPDFWQQVYQAPMLKLDARHVGLPFSQYTQSVWPGIPVPSLLHFMNYGPVGFDTNYPDFMPPDPFFGTPCDLQRTLLDAAQLGHISMPYSNPTWWDPNSFTLRNVSDLRPWAALNVSLEPYYETYPDVPTPRTGIATCPYSQLVQATIGQMLANLSWNATGSIAPPPGVPCSDVNASLPSTFVFEDQLGARWPHQDYSPLEQSMSYAGYTAGWQAHTSVHASVGLHTEQGFDRLARHLLGFHGTVLGVLNSGSSDVLWGDGNWRPVPMFGAAFRPLILHFQHDLDGGAQARSFDFMCWSLAMGIHLSLDIGVAPALRNSSWLAAVAAVQRVAASRYADYAVSSFAPWSPSAPAVTVFTGAPLTETYSSSYSVYWNNGTGAALLPLPSYWRPDLALVSGVPPGGCVAAGAAYDAIAGVFAQQYNNATLAGGGLHVIVEDRTCAQFAAPPGSPFSVCVWHTGADTPLTIVAQPQMQDAPVMLAVNATGGVIATVALNQPAAMLFTFPCTSVVAGQNVSYYALAPKPAAADALLRAGRR